MPPLTFTIDPMSTPVRLTLLPWAVVPIILAGSRTGVRAVAALISLFCVANEALPQVISMLAPLLSSNTMMKRFEYASKSTITPTNRIHLIGWLSWKYICCPIDDQSMVQLVSGIER